MEMEGAAEQVEDELAGARCSPIKAITGNTDDRGEHAQRVLVSPLMAPRRPWYWLNDGVQGQALVHDLGHRHVGIIALQQPLEVTSPFPIERHQIPDRIVCPAIAPVDESSDLFSFDEEVVEADVAVQEGGPLPAVQVWSAVFQKTINASSP